jgi:hypothetical protein
MEKHENIALITMSVFTIVLIWKMARRFQMPSQELAITRFLSVVGIAGLVWTGVLGGKMVFDHAAGISTPALQSEIQNRAAGREYEGSDTSKTAPHVDPPGTPPHKH